MQGLPVCLAAYQSTDPAAEVLIRWHGPGLAKLGPTLVLAQAFQSLAKLDQVQDVTFNTLAMAKNILNHCLYLMHGQLSHGQALHPWHCGIHKHVYSSNPRVALLRAHSCTLEETDWRIGGFCSANALTIIRLRCCQTYHGLSFRLLCSKMR